MESTTSTLLNTSPRVAVRRILLSLIDDAISAYGPPDTPNPTWSQETYSNAWGRIRRFMSLWPELWAPEVDSADLTRVEEAYNESARGLSLSRLNRWFGCMSSDVKITTAHDAWRFRVQSALDDIEPGTLRPSLRAGVEWLTQELRPRLLTCTESVAVEADQRPQFRALFAAALRQCHEALDNELTVTTLRPPKHFGTSVADKVEALNCLLSIHDSAQFASTLETFQGLEMLCVELKDVERLKDWTGEARSMSVQVGDRSADLSVLCSLNEQRLERVVQHLEADWVGPAAVAKLTQLTRCHQAIEFPDGIEIERKYLLNGLPPEVQRGQKTFLWQGYLPGDALIERIRRIKNQDGERYIRTVKLGSGVSRIEVEEPCNYDLYRALWALTETRRVEKVRYKMTEGERVWEIDDFSDRPLVLAEIELSSPDEIVVFPDWLKAFVVREVTDESAFVNRCLAQ